MRTVFHLWGNMPMSTKDMVKLLAYIVETNYDITSMLKVGYNLDIRSLHSSAICGESLHLPAI